MTDSRVNEILLTATDQQVPTLVRMLPEPVRKIIGDLSNAGRRD